MPPKRDTATDHSQPSIEDQVGSLMETVRAMQSKLDASEAATKQKDIESKLREAEAEKQHESLVALISRMATQSQNQNSPLKHSSYHTGSTSTSTFHIPSPPPVTSLPKLISKFPKLAFLHLMARTLWTGFFKLTSIPLIITFQPTNVFHWSLSL